MNRIIAFALLGVAFAVGCTGPYQRQMEQTLLLQENQRLEQALYITHSQLVDLKKENEVLRGAAAEDAKSSSDTPSPNGLDFPRPKKPERTPPENADEAPPFEMPKVSIPKEAPQTTIPDSLKGAAVVPKLSSAKTNSGLQLYPPVPVKEMKELPPKPAETGPTFPEWGPTR